MDIVTIYLAKKINIYVLNANKRQNALFGKFTYINYKNKYIYKIVNLSIIIIIYFLLLFNFNYTYLSQLSIKGLLLWC